MKQHNKSIERAIGILVQSGTKREYAEELFECLANPTEEAGKIIADNDYAKACAKDLNFVND